MSDNCLGARGFSIFLPNQTRAPGPSSDDVGMGMGSIPNPYSNTDSSSGDADEDDTAAPAERFGMQLGVFLGLIVAAWAFVGPAHPLAVSQFEFPVVATFRRPTPGTFFGYVGAVTLVFAAVGAIAYPMWRPSAARADGTDGEIVDYETAFANGLVKSVVGTTVAIAILGFLAPDEYFVVVGEVVPLTALIFVVGSVPITIFSYAGAHFGGFVRSRTGIGPDSSSTDNASTIQDR